MGAERKKLIFMTSRFPFPLHKGDKVRAFFQLKSLARDFEIHLICLNEKAVAPKNYEQVSIYCSTICCFHLPLYKRVISAVCRSFGKRPLQVAYFYIRNIAREITKLINSISTYYIHFRLIRMLPYLNISSKKLTSLDFMDAFSTGMQRRAIAATNPIKGIVFRLESQKQN